MSSPPPDQIVSKLQAHCAPLGLECHPFKVGWYNGVVQTSFRLPHHPDTLALIIISTPSMFERIFKPFLGSAEFQPETMDPLDQCMKKTFKDLAELFEDLQVETIHDFESHANKRPKVLVQTAGHVAGAARYYQRSDITGSDPWSKEERIYGVSMHPKYGGWFALRGVLIFKDILVPDLEQKEPIDCVPTDEMKIDVLHKYNTCWKDWTFREVCVNAIKERYSEEQKLYFETPPKGRHKLIMQYQL